MIRIGKFLFKPKLITTVFTLILLGVLVRLGIWQLDRAEEKRQILADQKARYEMPVIKVNSEIDNIKQLQFRRVQVVGRFESRYQLFIDNKIHNGKPGYFVVTPLKLRNQQKYVLINRGWVPASLDRSVLPRVETPQEEVTVNGLIKADPKDVADLGSANRSNTGWPAVVRWVDLQVFQKETHLQVLPFLLLIDQKEKHGFIREWKFVTLPPEKSTSYAVTWFSLAIVLLIIYLSVNTRRITENE